MRAADDARQSSSWKQLFSLLSVGLNGGAAAWGQTTGQSTAQTPLRDPNPQVPVFKAGIDLVRIAAVVRDRKGRFVQDLTAAGFRGARRRARPGRSPISGTTSAA